MEDIVCCHRHARNPMKCVVSVSWRERVVETSRDRMVHTIADVHTLIILTPRPWLSFKQITGVEWMLPRATST